MKAVCFERFGGADVLAMRDLPTPVPAPGEVAIDIAYASVNPVDWKIREGHLKDALPHVFPIVPGWDAAGVVKSVGSRVTSFRPGDRVYAYCRKPTVQWGTYAECIVLDESSVARMPANLTFAEAAAIPLTGLTAWQALYDVAKLEPGQTLFVSAGAGGVGGLAIQFARQTGARIITTAGPHNHGYVRELGADHAIDYTSGDWVEAVKALAPGGVDVAFDCAGHETLEKTYGLVKKGGTLVSIVETPDPKKLEAAGVRGTWHFVAPNGGQLVRIAALIEAGAVRPPQIEVMPLEQAAEAMVKNQTRHVRGKIVLKVR